MGFGFAELDCGGSWRGRLDGIMWIVGWMVGGCLAWLLLLWLLFVHFLLTLEDVVGVWGGACEFEVVAFSGGGIQRVDFIAG